MGAVGSLLPKNTIVRETIMDKKRSIEVTSPLDERIRPKQSANTLFHFMDNREYLMDVLSKTALIPRYCGEDISYLDIYNDGVQIKNVAYPEKCFCDIPLHKMLNHRSTYGGYGIGLTKSWGVQRGLQPIQYINSNSFLTEDFRTAFHNVMERSEEYDVDNFLLTYMFYIKPYFGNNKSRITGEVEKIYLTDECEWRFIPKVQEHDLPPILIDRMISEKNNDDLYWIDEYNKTLLKLEDLWLKFSIEDIKYVLVPTEGERKAFISFIEDCGSILEKPEIISKLICLDDAEEDF